MLNPRGNSGERRAFYTETVEKLFPDQFFIVAMGKPDPQSYEIRWPSPSISEVELHIGPPPFGREVQGIPATARNLNITAKVIRSPQLREEQFSLMRKLADESDLIANFNIGPSEKDGTSIISFRIPQPHNPPRRIRSSLVKFARIIEAVGIPVGGEMLFDWTGALKMNDFGFAESDPSVMLQRLEEIDNRAYLDQTQARVALDAIMRKF